MNEHQLDDAIRGLSAELKPERELWTEIANHLPARAAATSPLRYVASAALVLLGLIGWQLTLLPDGRANHQAATMPTTELMLLQVYEQQKAQQLSAVSAVAVGFDNWQQQLQIWDQAIAQVRQGLQFYPDEPQLIAQMQHLYQQQLSYIHQATLQQPAMIN